ncbi:hypothetical protein [Streptomyces orinoci]|uniref:Integral membrane protein n=1 Tax=Streptomyces orinoci TaxID=67339 RepID=A0ABV3JV64_STRON|nr:hypothetical protein [Streptomyces orinoci]
MTAPPAAVTAAIALVPPAVGGGVDLLTGSAHAWGLALGAVLAALWATAFAAAHGGVSWVIPLPPLVVFAVTAVGSLLFADASPLRGEPLTTAAARWAVHSFPVMVAAQCAALAVLVLRAIRTPGGGGHGHA